jgi:2-iminobutanoate/2-iminopropanoate deaminase
MPWEQEYGYSQAVKVGDTIYLSGQVSHDDKGNIVGLGDMEAQMRQAYSNVEKVLALWCASLRPRPRNVHTLQVATSRRLGRENLIEL